MNLTQFFDHWAVRENPFRGEEARNDAVFQRLTFERDGAVAEPRRPIELGSAHSDFEKILGELTRPSTSIVFGEKGSGKTAIRLQIADRVAAHNAKHPASRIYIIAYDDLNPYITELTERYRSSKSELAPFKKARLVDHMDVILTIATSRLLSGLFREGADAESFVLPDEYVKTVRRFPYALRRDLLVLQALYDNADVGGERAAKMRRLLRLRPSGARLLSQSLVVAGWIPAVAAGVFAAVMSNALLAYLAIALAAAYLLILGKRFIYDAIVLRRLAKRVRHEMRMVPRSIESLSACLGQLDTDQRDHRHLPELADADEPRYHLLDTLRRTLAKLGYTGVIVLIDRVDEPTAVNGDADKMRELMWPLFNNKFLQQEGFGVKMLLPIELRHALFKESSQFFQEARLDKQSLVERLTWTGPMLYDLCNARLSACRDPEAEPINLIDLFAEDVTRSDLVDALDQMHQPRDAFKMIYRVLLEHCSSVTADEGAWRIPKLILDQVRRVESDRVQSFYRGIRPA